MKSIKSIASKQNWAFQVKNEVVYGEWNVIYRNQANINFTLYSFSSTFLSNPQNNKRAICNGGQVETFRTAETDNWINPF